LFAPNISSSASQIQLLQRNSNQGFRYMGNSRSGMEASAPQGVVGPVMPLSFDGSGMPATPIDIQRPGQMHISALLSSLASASPENQRAVSCSSLI
jgi:polyadenylate-binding protein